MRALKTLLLLTLAASLTIACSSSEPTTSNSNQSARPADAAQSANSSAATPATPTMSAGNSNQSAEADPAKIDAATIYNAQKCGLCHGPDGKGKVKGTPDFSDKAWQQKTTDAAMTEQIKKGKVPQMPPYEGKLSDAEINALIAYIRTFGK